MSPSLAGVRPGLRARKGPAAAWLAALLIPWSAAPPAAAQEIQFESPDAVKLQPTSSSAEAVRHFWMGLDDAENVFPARAVQHIDQALQLDPGFGLARALKGFAAPGLSPEERQAEIRRGLAAMSGATSPELLVATAWLEWRSGNLKAAKEIATAAAALAPDDPHLAFGRAQLVGSVKGPAEGVKAMEEVTRKFPSFAPAWNILAYQRWQTGDREGAMTAVRTYVELLPDHPNPHDSYAELLQWGGQLDEAAAHYQRAVELSPDYDVGYVGLAEVRWLQGNVREARVALEKAVERAPTPVARLNTRRAVANTYLMAGDRRAAERQLQAVASEAEAADVKWLAALIYRQMAVIDALGRGTGIEAHLAKAAGLEGEESPGQYAWAALAYATAGKKPEAQEAIGRLEATAGDDTGLRTAVHATKAILLLGENNPQEAMAELEKADAGQPMVRALKAECHKKLRQAERAREIRRELTSDPTVNFYNPVLPFALIRVREV